MAKSFLLALLAFSVSGSTCFAAPQDWFYSTAPDNLSYDKEIPKMEPTRTFVTQGFASIDKDSTDVTISYAGASKHITTIYGGVKVSKKDGKFEATSSTFNLKPGENYYSIFGGGLSEGVNSNSSIGTTSINIEDSSINKPQKIQRVFGGGNSSGESSINKASSTTINVKGGSIIQIYGGGLAEGKESQSFVETAEIKISGGSIEDVFGGGLVETGENSTASVGSTKIEITGGTITGFLVGGGGGTVEGESKVENATVTIKGGDISAWVMAGGLSTISASVGPKVTVEKATLNIENGAKFSDYPFIFGGGGTIIGNELSNGQSNAFSEVNESHVNLKGATTNWVFGGGYSSVAGARSSVTESTVTVSGGKHTLVFGGGYSQAGLADVNQSNVILEGATTTWVFGGGYSSVSGARSSVTESTVTVSGGEHNMVFGGGYSTAGRADVNQSNVNLQGATTKQVFGGGWSTVAGASSSVKDQSTVTVSAGTHTQVFGGGYATAGATDVGNSRVVIKGGEILSVVGGGMTYSSSNKAANSSVKNGTFIDVQGGKIDTIYGGGIATGTDESVQSNSSVSNGATITVSGGSVKTIVLGGFSINEASSTVTGDSSVTLLGNDTEVTGNIFLANQNDLNGEIINTPIKGDTSAVFKNEIKFSGTVFGHGKITDHTSKLVIDYTGDFKGDFTNLNRLEISSGQEVKLHNGLGLYQFGDLSELTISGGGLARVENFELPANKALIVKGAALSAQKATLNAGTLSLTADWKDGAPSLVSIGSLTNDEIGTQIYIGKNSALTIGDLDKTAVQLLNQVEKQHSDSDIKSLLYIAGPVTLTKDAFIHIGDQNIMARDAAGSNGVLVKANSALIVNSEHGKTTITGMNGEDAPHDFTMEENSLVVVDNAVAGKDVHVAENFKTMSIHGTTQYLATNRALTLEKKSNDEDGELVLGVKAPQVEPPTEPSEPGTAEKILGDVIIPNTVLAASSGAEGLGAERLQNILHRFNGLTDDQVVTTINSVALMGAASGAQTMAVTTADWIMDSLNLHGSKLAAYDHEKSGADLWIDVDGIFSKAGSYDAGSERFGYKSDLTGFTVGGDYAFGNGAALGLAASFGKGSVRGQGTGSGIKNKVDYYGVNAYGVWNTPYANFIGTVGYLQSKNEIKQMGFKGKPDAKTFAVGVRVEKPLALNEAITVTPHVGFKYLHVKLDSFKTGGFAYGSDKANLFQVPFGVAFNGNIQAPCGAKVKPFIDLTIAPNFGDRKVSNKVGLVETGYLDSFDARIANNAMYKGKIGVEASKGNHSFGLNYGIGSGDKGRVDQTLQAKYRYQF